jgi:hypothetical protein
MTIFVQLALLASLMTSTPTTPIYPNCFDYATMACEKFKPCTTESLNVDYKFCAFQMAAGHTPKSIF